MQPKFQGIEIKPGMRIKVLTTLSHNKEVVTLLVEEIHTDLNNHPLCTDPTGSVVCDWHIKYTLSAHFIT